MNNQPDNLAIYDAGWESWHDMRLMGPASRWLRSLIADTCKHLPEPPQSIHDVGCGEGTTTEMLAQLFPNASVRGSDFSNAGIEVANKFYSRPNLVFTHDPDNQALSEPADLVCAFEVLEHIEDWKPFLAKMAISARTHVLFSFPTGRMRPFEVNIGHFRNFQKEELETELMHLGFRPARISYAGFPWYSPFYRELCQLTNAGDASFTRGQYGLVRRLICSLLYFMFRYASTRRKFGDQFVGLFERVCNSSS